MENAELITALRHCGNFEDRDGCDEECPYFNDKDCPKRIMCDAADALEAEDKRIAELEKALNIVELADEYRERLTECEQKIKRNVELLRWVDYALALAEHADILRAYYYEKKPMPVIATEKHISTATAWRYERIGVASICAI